MAGPIMVRSCTVAYKESAMSGNAMSHWEIMIARLSGADCPEDMLVDDDYEDDWWDGGRWEDN